MTLPVINPNNMFVKFIVENFTRWRKKSPLFFKIWQVALGIIYAITGLPSFLKDADIHVWDVWLSLHVVWLSYFSSGALFMSFLTGASDPVSVNPEGEVNKVTDAKLLPFTAAVEQRQAAKLDLPQSES